MGGGPDTRGAGGRGGAGYAPGRGAAGYPRGAGAGAPGEAETVQEGRD